MLPIANLSRRWYSNSCRQPSTVVGRNDAAERNGAKMQTRIRRTTLDIHDVNDAQVKLTHFRAEPTKDHKEFWTLRVRMNVADESGTEVTLFLNSREEVERVVRAFQNINWEGNN